ncbi:MAG: PPC domain-containing DNA-binding protein [Candidatus Geothermarchaeales archaeon]
MGEIGSGRLKRVVVATVEPDKDLLASLEEVARREGIRAGLILSVAGSLKRANIRNVKEFPKELPVRDVNRMWKVIEDRPLEILSVVGNIHQRGGETQIHAHITVSTVVGGEVFVFGGHLVEGNITFVNVEAALAELEGVEMVRKIHPERKTWELTLS